MGRLQNNRCYLQINGREYADPDATNEPGIFVSIDDQPYTSEDVDTTGGSGTEWKGTGAGLTSQALTITILCDDQRWIQDISTVTNGLGHGTIVPIEYGKNGRTAGNLRHRANYKVSPPSGPPIDVNKPVYMLTINAMSDGEPIVNSYAGATYT